MLQPETIDELVISHDELRLVVQGCFACILKHDLLDSLDAFLFAEGVAEGFSQRADEIRKQVMRERIIHLA